MTGTVNKTGRSDQSSESPSSAALKHSYTGLLERFGLVIAWVLTIVLFAALNPHTFFTVQTFATIFSSQAVLVVLALALLLPLTAGDYDLSAAATLTLGANLIGVLNVNHGWPIAAAIVVALLAGALVGFINGALSVGLGIESFIVTLGVGSVLYGIVLWISGTATISGISPGLVNAVITPKIFHLGLGFFYALILGATVWYVLEYTPLGRRLLFVGRGRRVARLTGINVGRMRWGAFVGCGLLSAGAGVMYAGVSGSSDPTSGAAFLLPAFAACFLGLTSILPGRFNAWGTIVAVYFLTTGITGLAIMGVQVYVQDLFYGGALIIGVAVSQIARGGLRNRDESN